MKKPECPEGAENYCYHSGYPDKFRHSELFPMSSGEPIGRSDRQARGGASANNSEGNAQAAFNAVSTNNGTEGAEMRLCFLVGVAARIHEQQDRQIGWGFGGRQPLRQTLNPLEPLLS